MHHLSRRTKMGQWDREKLEAKEAKKEAKRQKMTASSATKAGPNKSRTSTVKGKRGALQKISELNLDVLGEIFQHLHPLGLLRLSWTTKALRDFLTRRSTSIHIWKGAFARVEGLPECPPDLSYLQYARLAFDSRCYFCPAKNVTVVRWACRVRCCSKCVKDRFVSASWLINFLPGSVWTGFYEQNYPVPYYKPPMRLGSYDDAPCVLRSDYECLKQAVKAMNNESLVRDLITELMAYCSNVQAHADRCEEWCKAKNESRYLELDRLREKWRKEKLTDKIWSNMKDEAIRYMEIIRADRLEDERTKARRKRQAIVAKLFQEYSSGLPTDGILPTAADVCEFAPFSHLIGLPAEEEVNIDAFAQPMVHLPELIAAWRQSTTTLLLEMVPGSPSDVAHLYLASTFFRCLLCDTPVRYPTIGIHHSRITLTSASAVYNASPGIMEEAGWSLIIPHIRLHALW
ncbi:hypothetical protein PLICRDRAFT_175143 [Plicaturopsis crispa FD-325 SS-3]|nr:hypothetical protein PLICRDRAFT_175143 [Plicaturopsis crispa FD-325 SS-3]